MAFRFGGITPLVVASQVRSWRWPFIVSGILAIAAAVVPSSGPTSPFTSSSLVAWYLIIFGTIHRVSVLAGPKLAWWWTVLLLGVAELVLGVWAVRS